MLDDCKLVNENCKKQILTPVELKQYLSWDEIKTIYDNYYKFVTKLLNSKNIDELSMKTLKQYMVKYLLLAFSTGMSCIPPRRSLDYTEMRIRNYNKDTDNYYDSKTGMLCFNRYKTAKTYGRIFISVKEMAPELFKILQKWIKINKGEYMLSGPDGEKFSVSNYTHMLNGIFGRKISTDVLRHIYITHFYENQKLPNIIQMENLARLMGHSVATQIQYVKSNIPD